MRRALDIDEELRQGSPRSPFASTTSRGCSRPRTGWRGRAAHAPGAGHRRAKLRQRSSQGRHPPQQPGPSCSRPRTASGEAEPLMRRALAIDENSFGKDHPNVAIRLNNLAELLQATNRLAEAEPLMRRALDIDEQSYGTSIPRSPSDLNNLAAVAPGHEPPGGGRAAHAPGAGHRREELRHGSPQRRHSTSTTWPRCSRPRTAWQRPSRSCAARWPSTRKATAPIIPMSPADLNNLAQLLQATNRLAEAEPLSRRAVGIVLAFTRHTGHEHPHLHRFITKLQEHPQRPGPERGGD